MPKHMFPCAGIPLGKTHNGIVQSDLRRVSSNVACYPPSEAGKFFYPSHSGGWRWVVLGEPDRGPYYFVSGETIRKFATFDAAFAYAVLVGG